MTSTGPGTLGGLFSIPSPRSCTWIDAGVSPNSCTRKRFPLFFFLFFFESSACSSTQLGFCPDSGRVICITI